MIYTMISCIFLYYFASFFRQKNKTRNEIISSKMFKTDVIF